MYWQQTDTQYQSAPRSLIETFEAELDSPGFTRGCPDFIFTVLTYAAVSLLRVTQPHFAYLKPDRDKIFSRARKASDMLARSAMDPDHLPASQSVFLRRLMESNLPNHRLAHINRHIYQR